MPSFFLDKVDVPSYSVPVAANHTYFSWQGGCPSLICSVVCSTGIILLFLVGSSYIIFVQHDKLLANLAFLLPACTMNEQCNDA